MRSVRGELIVASCAKAVSARENDFPNMLSVDKMCKACDRRGRVSVVICCAFVGLMFAHLALC